MTENNLPSIGPKRDAKAQAKADKAYKKATRPWYKKKRFIFPLALVALIAVITAMSGGGGSDNTANNASTTNNNTPAAENPDDPAPAEAPAEDQAEEPAFPGAQSSDVIGQAGDELKLGDVAVTSSALAAGDATFGETLCTTVKVANNSSETIDFNIFDWKMQSPGGTILNTSITGTDNSISTGQIAPGGSANGDVCFDAKDAQEGQYIVLYEPILSFFSDRAAWINK
ncbi:DUF4352 domain-containing protein [Arthrobacter sp. USHLN218]|uniref:DUF4352 domain-containing protein n=1 Tax=Arthrobacter sp. USHLN218 TaxID=3081232 RepID=UPI003018C727